MSKYVSPDDAKYPVKLKDHLQDPKKIYYRGELDLACKPSIAIVGSRKCTPYGITVARVLSTKAAEYGAVIVSGLARSIDLKAVATLTVYRYRFPDTSPTRICRNP